MTRKALPDSLTSYDFLKALAVVLMVADHIGAYYLPDMLWLRVAGRLCVPMWFFLIGYARSRDLGRLLWWGALLVILSDFVAGRYIFPLNVLVTILLVRMLIDLYMKFAMRSSLAFWCGAMALAALVAPSALLTQYGTQGLLLAAFGWIVRHMPQNDHPAAATVFPYIVFCTLVFTLTQWSLFRFSPEQTTILFLGTLLTMATLRSFRPIAFTRLTNSLPAGLTILLQGAGRHTLLIYVTHLLLIKIAGLWLYPEWFNFLGWELLPPAPWLQP
ncbi:MAG: hypothetical protein HYS17_00770 [Micavibrio aeruginosavorus]|uniref:TraX family protein n=1 Tax=Micavibrio aeruginosavorus TaxID=349221 RepID=A0A7T5R2I6_9BACT|nr:MAG: hypothetical protein HYS17_00770 [Micavibrio aeruginosavorus]